MDDRHSRESVEQKLYAQFSKAFDNVLDHTRAVSDESRRVTAAGRIALEHAVLRTANEKAVQPSTVASMADQHASPQQAAMLVNKGRESVRRSFGVEPETLVSALSAKVADVDLPRGFNNTDHLRKLVNEGQKLVMETVAERYQTRGTFQHNGHSDYLQNQQSGAQKNALGRLQNHMVFVESAIDHGVSSGKFDAAQGKMLKERVEAQVFSVPTEKFADTFKDFYSKQSQSLRHEVMTSAREVTQSQTVRQIAERLDMASSARVATARQVGPER